MPTAVSADPISDLVFLIYVLFAARSPEEPSFYDISGGIPSNHYVKVTSHFGDRIFQKIDFGCRDQSEQIDLEK